MKPYHKFVKLNTSNRYFLKALTSRVEVADMSMIQHHLTEMDALDKFKELTVKNLCFIKKRKWDGNESSSDEDEDKVHVIYSLEPPPRRPRIENS